VKVAVTGATGFIGRYVVTELERHSMSPVLICRHSTEIPEALSRHTALRVDLGDSSPRLFEAMGAPDVLIHLAWGGLPNYQSLHHFEEELPAQYRFLKGMIESGLKNLLVTGTCFEYGMQFGPLGEDIEPRPGNPYGFAKDALRRQLEYLKQVKPVNLTWARLFYLYGYGQAQTSLLPQLEKAVARGDRVFNMSGGDQLRDYMPVGEAARYLVCLALNGRDNGVVNVCSGIPVSVRKLVERWIGEHAWSIDLNLGHYPYPVYEPMAFWGEKEKLERCMQAP
jgi:dTDP-6-deoxy-L-talose 4-dehydrogenase (NAD+)